MSILSSLFSPNVEKLESKRDTSGLIAALSYRKPQIRAAAALALGRIGDSTTIDSLIPMLQDSDSDVRLATIRSLSSLRDAKAIEPLLKMLKIGDNQTRVVASKVLKEWKTDPRVMDALTTCASQLRESRKSSAIQWWQAAPSGSKNCDVCSQPILPNQGYLLETDEVIESDNYIDYATDLRMKMSDSPQASYIPGLDPFAQNIMNQGVKLAMSIPVRADIQKVRTPWLVCDSCLDRYFK